jgi:AMIN domain
MKTINSSKRILLFVIVCFVVPCAFAAETEITRLGAVSDGDALRITIELTSPVKPNFWALDKPTRLIFDFPNVALETQTRWIPVNHAGIGEVRAEILHGNQLGTRISIDTDRLPRFGMKTLGNTVVLTILPQPWEKNAGLKAPITSAGVRESIEMPDGKTMAGVLSGSSTSAPPEIERIPLGSSIDEPPVDSPATVRRRFRIKFVSGKTVYINGGSNAGLRTGMNLDIWNSSTNSATKSSDETPVGSARIVGVATTSAILDVGASSGELQMGDWAELVPGDADMARQDALAAPGNTLRAASRPLSDTADSLAPRAARSFRTTPEDDTTTRTAGRIGFDSTGISSSGSTPGTSLLVGMSFQSDMKHILGTHWNLEGYWRGFLNHHSQFFEDTIGETLNKTYTMQLYYDNPHSKWVAGVGRLYLPWAVTLDTIDGGYFGRKSRGGMTTGVFAGSTPDLTSWHYRPNQRIGGVFTNFEGGDYDGIHYSSTTGVGLTSVKWKLDRPFMFFENEFSYKGKLSAFHSLTADSPQGPSTNGSRPGPGVSHSYLTLHYQPYSRVSLDLYHNFFRDVPTVPTSVIGTGIVDKLLFQGISAGTHVRPTRYFTLYTTLGASEKTGDAHRSLNEMFGATWNEIAHTGLRADFRYSQFDSNFGNGHYDVLTLSRQMTHRVYWNFQLGKQDVVSPYTTDSSSNFMDDSFDVNLGRHSYLQSGFTYEKGNTLNYRQWYMSWGYRFDEGRKNPQYVQSLVPRN